MELIRYEVRRIVPKRWALMTVPGGLILGVAVTAEFLSAPPNRNDWLPAVLLFTPVITGVVAFAGWLQAVIFNLFVRLTGAGPVVEVAIAETRRERLARKTKARKIAETKTT